MTDLSIFRDGLIELINKESIENGSNTPDYILADYLVGCLSNFNENINNREARNKGKEPGWENMAKELWQLLDDIDTTDDVARSDDIAFRRKVRSISKRRNQHMYSADGYNLVVTPECADVGNCKDGCDEACVGDKDATL